MANSKRSRSKPDLPDELRSRISKVTEKRARFVLDSIVRNGSVSTEEISNAGYDHPPRAAQDVRDLGFPLKTVKVKHTNGRSIAAYTLDLDKLQNAGMRGRRFLPKKERQAVIQAAGGKCAFCGSTVNLQIDHRIPYMVGGESTEFQVLCGSCNRKKSWACEHCPNFLELKEPANCRSCYWSGSNDYTHVAMVEERRTDLVWIGKPETDVADRLSREAKNHGKQTAEYIKERLEQIS